MHHPGERWRAGWCTVAVLALTAAPAMARRADDPALSALSSHLLTTAAPGPRERAPDEAMARARTDGTLTVDLRFTALTPAAVAAIEAAGARVEYVSYRHGRVLAHVAPDQLPALAALSGLTAVHPEYGAVLNSGAVAPQGDAPMRSDVARLHFGVDGHGVRVGLLSDSFARRLGGATTGQGCARRLAGSRPQLSGDLPPEVTVLEDGPAGAGDEGAALGEIVHDIAPGAALLFASAFPSEAAFADGIDRLVACGVDVLVDDVLYFAEPMFQDGIIAQSAQAAVDAGIPVYSAVGNHGRAGIAATYRDAIPERNDEADLVSGDDLHDFGGGERFAPIVLPAGCGIRLVLQWDEPFSGTLGPGASTDLDLYLFDAPSPDGRILQSSTDSQGCSRPSGPPAGDPLEILAYTNRTGGPRTVYAAVDHFCGNPDLRFRLVTFPLVCEVTRYDFDADVFSGPQIYGHIAAAGVTAVAAVFFADAEPGGDARIEPFSARGGDIPIAFDGTGARLPGGPVTRFKPDLTAPDGVNTTFFGSDSPRDPDTFPNFLGTSAAAPHVAGVAALMRQAVPDLTVAALDAALRMTARELETPGRDELAGYGIVDAFAALEAILQQLTPTALPTATATPQPPTATIPPIAVAGDCDGDGRVLVEELIMAVRIALDESPLSACPAIDTDGSGTVSVDELIAAVRVALSSEPA